MGGGGTGQACCGVAGGRPTTAPFTAHAFSVLVFFKGISGGGISGTGGAEHLAFLFVLGLMEGECVSGFTGTGRTITTGLAFLEGRGEARAVGLLTLLGDAVVDTVTRGSITLPNDMVTRGSVNFIPGSSWGEKSKFVGHRISDTCMSHGCGAHQLVCRGSMHLHGMHRKESVPGTL